MDYPLSQPARALQRGARALDLILFGDKPLPTVYFSLVPLSPLLE